MVVNPENCSLLIVNTQSVTMIWVFLHLHKQEREQSPKKVHLKEKNFLFSFFIFFPPLSSFLQQTVCDNSISLLLIIYKMIKFSPKLDVLHENRKTITPRSTLTINQQKVSIT